MSKKRTLDQINAEIDKVNREISKGRDRHVMQALLGVLEKERYEAIAAGRVPLNHITYASARDQQRATVIRGEIEAIDKQIATAPEERLGILQGDRARLVSDLALYQIIHERPIQSEHVDVIKIDDVVPAVVDAKSDSGAYKGGSPNDAAVLATDANPTAAADVSDPPPAVRGDDKVADPEPTLVEEPALPENGVISEDVVDHQSTDTEESA